MSSPFTDTIKGIDDITEEVARKAPTADIVVVLSTATTLFTDITRRGGVDGVASEMKRALQVDVVIGKITKEDLDEKAKTAHEQAVESMQLITKTLEVFGGELNRRIPIPATGGDDGKDG